MGVGCLEPHAGGNVKGVLGGGVVEKRLGQLDVAVVGGVTSCAQRVEQGQAALRWLQGLVVRPEADRFVAQVDEGSVVLGDG